MDEETNEPEQKNYISCLNWVKKGIAASVPDKIELTAQELQNIIKETHSELQKQNKDENTSDEDTNNINIDEDVKDDSIKITDEFDFEKYDEESGNIYCNINGIAVINNEKDPFITVDDNEDDSEKEDDIIKANDNLLLVGHVVDEASILEVYVYNEAEGSFYCHHHDYLPYIPLCFEWLNFDPAEEKPGNLCAIGNDTPIIEVWDLDVIGGVGSVFKLGQKSNKKKRIKRIGHKDAVLDLAWNTYHNHVLASGSADCTSILWDLETGSPNTILSSFNGIVQSLKWHPTDSHMLLTGSMDKKVRLFDCNTEIPKIWNASGEVEKVVWNNSDPNTCFISTDNGYIECIDIRCDKPLWQHNVQKEEVAGLSMSTLCPGLLFSSNKDGTVKVWDVINHLEPQLVFEKQTNLGHIICLEASCDNPFTFAAGGDNKAHNLNVFDFKTVDEVFNTFKNRTPKKFEGENNLQETENNVQSEVMDVTENFGTINLEQKVNIKKKKKFKRSSFK
ncbi:PREDICTED: periodic tryptophan protein 1 homolog [Ceratosolen solmsi marchali]|uniref:Periodic tryptophan protein 1 homolog n=1 Tax=Ceratosolen solmsi marchali TaxID=326594 RepID=A0AAJ6YDJ4_9HYME|nr:PREDICTED: periodic tryptophan protein 1 homolog [Ceratosolen solmsi marchali]